MAINKELQKRFTVMFVLFTARDTVVAVKADILNASLKGLSIIVTVDYNNCGNHT